MSALVFVGPTCMDTLKWHINCQIPQPVDTNILIRLEACGINNTDVNTRSGRYSKTVPEAATGDEHDAVNTDKPSRS